MEVRLGPVPVGDGHPTVFVAEFSTFWNQDLGLAREYIDRAREAGVQVVKSEVLHTADVCLPGPAVHRYAHAGGSAVENYRALIERKVLSLDAYRRIFEHCRAVDLPFVASVYDATGVDFLADVGAAGIKFARDAIDNLPLIRRAARTRLPLIFDAGDTRFIEVATAVDAARSAGDGGVVVNYHPARNPAPAAAHSLLSINRYKTALGVPTGLACHYAGVDLMWVSVGLGANLIEKGVDRDPQRAEQDVVSAISFDELGSVLRRLRDCWDALGDPYAEPVEPRDLSTRRGLVAARQLGAGDTISEESVTFAFPPVGIPVAAWDFVVGKALRGGVEAGSPIQWSDLGNVGQSD